MPSAASIASSSSSIESSPSRPSIGSIGRIGATASVYQTSHRVKRRRSNSIIDLIEAIVHIVGNIVERSINQNNLPQTIGAEQINAPKKTSEG